MGASFVFPKLVLEDYRTILSTIYLYSIFV